MGRGRAPCCEKIGLNKGAWTPEEDMRLVAYINKHGHSNWRALPKQAGLLRCGKSCRLRWINYLRPDIKRGNFSEEEEETIFKLHELLGNKWSLIASRLPGRTDNEIKNVWNTHLKKRLASKEPKPPATATAGDQSPASPSSCPSSTSASDDTGDGEKAGEETTMSTTTTQLVVEEEQDQEQVSEEEEEEEERIEIPVEEPNLDLWGMLEDSLLPQPPELTNLEDNSFPSDIPSSSSDYLCKQEDPLNEMLDLPVISEMLELMEEESDQENKPPPPSISLEEEGSSSSSEWLAYLEKELDLWEKEEKVSMDGVEMMTMEYCDPISSYFYRGPSSPSPLETFLTSNVSMQCHDG